MSASGLPPASRAAEAEIRDVRYGTYAGERRGRGAAVLSLARWGALRSLGARRGWKAKAVPITLILLAIAPAVIVLGVRALFADQTGIDLTEALPFSGYQAIIGVVILLFAGITTPELLCPDRRDGMLQLYFSTAVSRGEYLAGRVIGAIAPLLLVTMVPMLVLYAGILVFEEHPVGYLEDNWAELPRIVAAGVILAVYYGLVGLAVSSLTGRRAFAIGGYLLLLVAPTLLSALLQEAFDGAEELDLISLSTLPIGFAGEIFPDARDEIPNSLGEFALAYLVVVAAAVVVLLRRYRPGSEG
ncbi:MAG TPA: ABC transporter permease subunit [Miltoncostaeaceae bacterium]|nr:ABC transporter permease subunit [Miltoncostaeaceae bacterium]